MVQRGYAGTSVGDLAKAVGLTKAGLYHHIRSKQELLFQILQHALDLLEREVIEPTRHIEDPEARLRETIRLHVGALLDHGLEITLLFPERRHLEPAEQQQVTQRVDAYAALLCADMRELADGGKLRDLERQIAARHILQTIAGIARWYKEDSGISRDLLLEQTITFILSAILKR